MHKVKENVRSFIYYNKGLFIPIVLLILILYIIVITSLYLKGHYSEYQLLLKDKSKLEIIKEIETLARNENIASSKIRRIGNYVLLLERAHNTGMPYSHWFAYEVAEYAQQMKRIKQIYHKWIIQNCTKTLQLDDVQHYLPLNNDTVLMDFVIEEDNNTSVVFSLGENADIPSLFKAILKKFFTQKLDYMIFL